MKIALETTLVDAIYNYLGTCPAAHVEQLRASMRQAVAEAQAPPMPQRPTEVPDLSED
jgi:hypothetical protein